MAVLLALVLVSCAGPRAAIICFAPENPAYRGSPQAILRDINLKLHTPLEPKYFRAFRSRDGLRFWIVAQDSGQIHDVRHMIDNSKDLYLISIGYCHPDDLDLFTLFAAPQQRIDE